MSDASLPDDLSRWPSDPYRLLSVPRDVDAREARRAYTRLIRTYKPETHPAQFQRIRQAYEAVQSGLQWRESVREPVVPEPEPARGDEQVEMAEPAAARPTSTPETRLERTSRARRAAPVDVDAQIDAAWKQLVEGNLAAGYQPLAELQRQYPMHEELPVRLYWLLRLDAELDPQREPPDWLARGMLARGLGGRLLELYRRELDARPAEALTDRCSQLLQRPAPTGRTFDLLTRRWSAAGRVSAWPVIGEDLRVHRDRYLPDEQQSWGRLLVTALRQLAWARDAEGERLFQQCRGELDDFANLHIDLSAELEDCEALLELARGPELGGHLDVPYRLIELVQDSFGATDECRPVLLNLLEEWSEQSLEALDALDRLKDGSTVALARIANLVQGLGGFRGREAEGLDERIVEQLRRVPAIYSVSARRRLLEFCLKEWITVDQLIRAAATAPAFVKHDLATALDADIPLQTVVRGVQVFRS